MESCRVAGSHPLHIPNLYLAVGSSFSRNRWQKIHPVFVKSTLLSLMIASLASLALFLSGKLYLFEKYLYVQFFLAVHDRVARVEPFCLS